MKNKILLFLFPTILFLCTVYITWSYGLHFPINDQWNLVIHIDKFYSGTLTYSDLFSQHNEHRLFFPRLIMIVLAYFTSWNISCEIFLNLFLGFLIFYFVVEQLHITFNLKENPYKVLIVGVCSLIYLSMGHFENWTWGWQIQIFLNVLMIFLSIFWLNKSEKHLKYFVLAIFTSIIATFSFANGIAIWIIGLMLIVSFNKITLKQKIQYFSAWLIIFLLIFGFYMWNYHTPEGLNHKSFTIGFLIKYVSFIFGYFGLMMHEAHEKWFVGLVLLIIYTIGTIYFFIKKLLFTPNIRIFWFLSLYSVMSAMITGLGRADFGNGSVGVYNVASRYVLIASFFWLFIFVFFFYILQQNTFRKQYLINTFIIVLIFGLSYHFFNAHNYGIKEIKGKYFAHKKASEELMKPNPDTTVIKILYGHTPTIVEGIKVLKKRKLAGLR